MSNFSRNPVNTVELVQWRFPLESLILIICLTRNSMEVSENVYVSTLQQHLHM